MKHKSHSIARRGFLKVAAASGAGALVLSQAACPKGASVGVEVSTGITFLQKVASLIPGKAQAISKIVAALNDFNSAYQAGKFDSAGSFFASMTGLFDSLVADLGINISPSVKIALALVDAAISAIAVLLKAQAPAVANVMSAMSADQQSQAAVIEARAAHAEKLFAGIKRQ